MDAFNVPQLTSRAVAVIFPGASWGFAAHGYNGEKRTLIIQGGRKKPLGWIFQPCVPPAGFAMKKYNGGQSPPAMRLPLVQKEKLHILVFARKKEAATKRCGI